MGDGLITLLLLMLLLLSLLLSLLLLLVAGRGNWREKQVMNGL